MLTSEQLTSLRAKCFADSTAATFFVTPGDSPGLYEFLNTDSSFVVRRTVVESSEIGPALNYDAVRGLTTGNRDKCTTFLALNPLSFEPTIDIEAYWEDALSGALNGQGANTRAKLKALWRRLATNVERMLATGVGTSDIPGVLVFEGHIPQSQVTSLIYKDDGSLWTAQG